MPAWQLLWQRAADGMPSCADARAVPIQPFAPRPLAPQPVTSQAATAAEPATGEPAVAGIATWGGAAAGATRHDPGAVLERPQLLAAPLHPPCLHWGWPHSAQQRQPNGEQQPGNVIYDHVIVITVYIELLIGFGPRHPKCSVPLNCPGNASCGQEVFQSVWLGILAVLSHS